MGILKAYVHNREKPEGSIIEGYTTEEVIEFCVDYMSEIDSISVPRSRHEGRLAGVGTIGRDNFETAYHAIISRPALAKFMAVPYYTYSWSRCPHYTYLMVKMPGPHGIITLRNDIKQAFSCEAESCEIAQQAEEWADQEQIREASTHKTGDDDLPSKKTTKITSNEKK
ncbi:uncharacterized protein LOC107305225 [Oryza brachyantha]|uniref:uncharacterized protein LOC107305225 n=1 Tax=Oryza brachyantha TaxID=4533 RepID=UPI001ADB2F52|nr:uncharacterized protein LOC107305225 [Oryza brachyantha]